VAACVQVLYRLLRHAGDSFSHTGIDCDMSESVWFKATVGRVEVNDKQNKVIVAFSAV
jgi:hypothetical protein